MEDNFYDFSARRDEQQLHETSNFRSGKRQTKSRDEYDIRRQVMHREVERQRRQEMSNLYASLSSCLPLERNKAKNSLCDEVQRAVDYIKQKQDDIKELRIRRDELKKLSKSSRTEVGSSNPSDSLADSVTVNHFLDGMEILVTTSFKSSGFGLSRVLAELLERELDVVSCDSTKTCGGFFHKIHIKNLNRWYTWINFVRKFDFTQKEPDCMA